MKKELCGIALMSLWAVLATTAPAQADDLAEVKARGVLRVGVKADYPPYGFENEAGEIVGLEPDLAADVAERLGVALELTRVVTDNRLKFLQADRIDLMIATMSVNPEREQMVEVIKPLYYAGEETVLARKGSGLSQWSDLEGKQVCGVRSAYYNDDVVEFGGTIREFKDATAALNGLRQGWCDAFVYDTTWFANIVAQPEWSDFHVALPPINPAPWGIAVDKGEVAFRDFMSDVITDWHASGKLLELEEKWGTPPSQFLRDKHAEFQG